MTKDEVLSNKDISIVHVRQIPEVLLRPNADRTGFFIRKWVGRSFEDTEVPLDELDGADLLVMEQKMGPFTIRNCRELGADSVDEIIWDSEDNSEDSFHLEKLSDNSLWFCLRIGGREIHVNISGNEGSTVNTIIEGYCTPQ